MTFGGAGRSAAALLAAALTLALPAFAQDPAPERIAGAENLGPIFQALSDLGAGRRAAPVQILQIGDSLTANDLISTALRARLQARFGAGGRGVMPVGSPYRGYHPDQVEADQTDGWRVEASFGPALKGSTSNPQSAPGPFGLSGWRLSTSEPGQGGDAGRPRRRLFRSGDGLRPVTAGRRVGGSGGG